MLDDPNTRNWVLGALQSRRKCLEPSGCPGQVEETWSVGRFLAAGPSVVWLWVRWGHERPQQLMWTLTPKTNLLESLNLLNPWDVYTPFTLPCFYIFSVSVLWVLELVERDTLQETPFDMTFPDISSEQILDINSLRLPFLYVDPTWGSLLSSQVIRGLPRFSSVSVAYWPHRKKLFSPWFSQAGNGRMGRMGPLDSVEEKRSIVALAIPKSMEKGLWIALFWNPIVLFYLSWFAKYIIHI